MSDLAHQGSFEVLYFSLCLDAGFVSWHPGVLLRWDVIRLCFIVFLS
jgi:hypothetical protein